VGVALGVAVEADRHVVDEVLAPRDALRRGRDLPGGRRTLGGLAQGQVRNADRNQCHDGERGDAEDLEEGFHEDLSRWMRGILRERATGSAC